VRVAVWSILYGIISGVVLGLFLKSVELASGKKVYTLLLNVDYIPFLKEIKTSELLEFCLHLVISIFVVIVLCYFLQRKEWTNPKKKWFVLWLSLAIGVSLYPTTMLSERTPEFTDLYAFLFWMGGHGIYGWLLSFLLTKKE
jgi:hypothetical protein